MDYQERIIKHYKNIWKSEPKIYYHDAGPANKLPYDFRVIEFEPIDERDSWIYATVCMSQEEDLNKIELHILSSKQDTTLIELLTAVAYFHRQTHTLDLNHTVNFGRAWQDNSICTYGFISLPYIDGPDLENLVYNVNNIIKCYWLIPVTENEVEYKIKNGVEELENLFEDNQFDYINPNRKNLLS